MKLNNTPPPDVTTVQITDERLTFGLEDGRTVSVPLSFYPTLQLATRRERADFEISHTSVYWPKLDCDISSDCLLRGARKPADSPSAHGAKRQSSPPPETEKNLLLARPLVLDAARVNRSLGRTASDHPVET